MRRICTLLNCALSRCLVMGLALFFFLLPGSVLGEDIVELGSWSREKIEDLLAAAGRIPEPGQRIAFISAAFLETPYLADTLIGSAETPEVFVLRLDGLDCFTLLDTVEALRRSADFAGSQEALRAIRYRDGRIDFWHRNHFFSDWGEASSAFLSNVTATVGGEGVRRIKKVLNQKADGSPYLPGIPVKNLGLAYIPAEAVDESVLDRLQSGDYVGIYSPEPGLDVSHSGIVVRAAGKVCLRHASSRSTVKRVVDEELTTYLGGTKGLVVYRAVAMGQESAQGAGQ